MQAQSWRRGAVVAVTLSPSQAQLVAETVRIQLSYACERMQPDHVAGQLVGRRELRRFRSTIDLYVDELESLQWGAAMNDIRVAVRRPRLEIIARELREAGEERIADLTDWHTPQARAVDRWAHEMIAAATVIERALEQDRDLAVA
jgi:hypothetical protein